MLPKVAFKRPPRVWFVYLATSSVTKEMRSASGIKATKEVRKVRALDVNINHMAKTKQNTTNIHTSMYMHAYYN